MTTFYTRMKAGRARAAEARMQLTLECFGATQRSEFYRRVYIARHPRVLFV